MFLSKISFVNGIDNTVNRNDWHKIVMSMLPNDVGENPRKKLNVLWSIENFLVPTLYVQSNDSLDPAKMSLRGNDFTVVERDLDYSNIYNNSENGFSYRIHVNPTTSNNGKRSAVAGNKDIKDWWFKKQQKHGIIPFNNNSFKIEENIVEKISKNGKTFFFSSAIIVGEGYSTNTEVLRKSVEEGIGRGKSYGTGLIMLSKK